MHHKIGIIETKSFKIRYDNEGMLGQLKVVDYHPPGNQFDVRKLLINGIPQTFILNHPNAYSFWHYPHFIAAFSSLKDSNAEVLLVGFGGGSVARELTNLHLKFDVVEVDPRIIPLAKKYFYINPDEKRVFIDDARHFIRKSKKQYDLIIFDVLSGETQPNHVFTLESLTEMRRLFKPGGMAVINFQGILNDKQDKAFASLNKTFLAAGYQTTYFAGNPDAFDDIIFTISLDKQDFSRINFDKLNECCRSLPMIRAFFKNPASVAKAGGPDIELLTDDKPILDHLNQNATKAWRKTMTEEITIPELKEGISLFR